MSARSSAGGDQPVIAVGLTLDWLDTLRITGTPQAPTAENIEAPVTRLLERGHAAAGGVALGVRFVGADGEVHVVTCGAQTEVTRLATDRSPTAGTPGQVVNVPLSEDSLAAGLRCHLVMPFFFGSGSLSFFDSVVHVEPAPELLGILQALAGLAPVLIENAATMAATWANTEQLHEAMVSRSVIEQAKGVLMATERISADTAWEYLVRMSQGSHRKLRDVCADVVARTSAGS